MCSAGHTPKERSTNLSEGTVSFLRRAVHKVALDQGGYRKFYAWSQGGRTFQGCGAALAKASTPSRAGRLVFGEGHSAAPACAVRGLCRERQAAKFH